MPSFLSIRKLGMHLKTSSFPPSSILSGYGLTLVGRLSHKSALKNPVILGPGDSLKIVLTATEDGKGKRPHQAFLLLRDPDTGLEATFPFSVKDTGKSKVDFVRIMSQFLS
jgi:oligosaccharyltransferase complex subunit delta (ribophorin II)